MTGEPVHAASKERMAPEVMWFLSEHMPQLSITDLNVYTAMFSPLDSATNEEQ